MKYGILYKGQVQTVLTHPPPPIILQKLIGTPSNLGVDPLFRPRRPFWDPSVAILDFEGTAALR